MKTLRIGLSYGDDEHYSNYPKALRRVGAQLGLDVEPIWIRHPERSDAQDVLVPTEPMDGRESADAKSRDHHKGPLDGIVFTGGEDVDPARYGREDARDLCDIDTDRDASEWALLEANGRLPVLAICRGSQLLNVYHGGTLIPHLATADDHVRHNGVDSEHAVVLSANTRLETMAAGDPRTNSSHHQAVDRLADPFRAIAHAPDGTLEAYEYADPEAHPFFLAMQWHPERMPERSLGDGPIAAFLTACAG